MEFRKILGSDGSLEYALKGHFWAGFHPDFQNTVMKDVETMSPRRIVFDMREVSSIDAPALSLLSSIACRGGERSGWLVLKSVTPCLRNLLRKADLAAVEFR